MATYTLTVSSNYSSIKGSLSNDDTIDCSGYELTIDEQPLLTGIIVISPGTAGTAVISGAWNLATWSFTAGTTTMIGAVPAGCTIGSLTSGVGRGCGENYGTILLLTSSAVGSAYGCSVNRSTGIIESAVSAGAPVCLSNEGLVHSMSGSPAAYVYHCQTNHNTILSVTGGNLISALGVATNTGTIVTCVGGSGPGAHGCSVNNGIIINSIGGSNATAYGCDTAFGQVLSGSDSVARAVGSFRGSIKFVVGADFHTRIVSSDLRYDPLKTLYSIGGPLADDAIIPAGVDVIELYEGPSSILHPLYATGRR